MVIEAWSMNQDRRFTPAGSTAPSSRGQSQGPCHLSPERSVLFYPSLEVGSADRPLFGTGGLNFCQVASSSPASTDSSEIVLMM